jgi:hypothetical protein
MEERFDRYMRKMKEDMRNIETEKSPKGGTSEDQDMMLIGMELAFSEAEKIIGEELRLI